MNFKNILRLQMSSIQAILLVSFDIAVADNWRLFQQLSARVDLATAKGLHLLALIVTLMVSLSSVVFVALGHRRLLKPLLVVALIGTASLSYFTQSFGIVFDREMIRNIHETIIDRNTQEAAELLSPLLVTHMVLFGIVPAVIVSLVGIRFKSLGLELRSRAIYLGGLLAALAVLILVNFKTVSFFARENKDLRSYANPFYAIDSTRKYISRELRSRAEATFTVIGADATRRKTSKTRLVGIMVVGETARADHFSLNGYPRITNPLLAKRDVVNFKKVTSSGTGTAYSVPAMFSLLAPSGYSPEKADKQSNVLMGSHGPTYHKRFPKTFATFTPFCEEAAPQNCTDEEVINAYDNTILYTDYILDMIIGYLDAHRTDYDSFMLYASDHGESLGENGIYLHGMPNLIAPEAQRHVPMILWMSTGCRVKNRINYDALRTQEQTPLSHVNIPHSLLGLFEVQTSVYNQACDIIEAGRGVARRRPDAP